MTRPPPAEVLHTVDDDVFGLQHTLDCGHLVTPEELARLRRDNDGRCPQCEESFREDMREGRDK